MLDPGYIYILVNPSLPDLVKVGKTSDDPKERARELSAATGVPTPFLVVFDTFFENCTEAEQHIHTLLDQRGWRVADNREFFAAPVSEVIKTVLEAERVLKVTPVADSGIRAAASPDSTPSSAVGDELLDSLSLNARQPWEDVFEQAENYYYGLGDTLEDYAEALKLYNLAAKLGCLQAYQRIGYIYSNGEGVPEDKAQALHFFKKGASKGEVDCYAEMGLLFMRQDPPHFENAQKCWNAYFSRAVASPKQGWYGYLYYEWSSIRGWPLEHLETLRTIKNEIIRFAEESLEHAREQHITERVTYVEANIQGLKELL